MDQESVYVLCEGGASGHGGARDQSLPYIYICVLAHPLLITHTLVITPPCILAGGLFTLTP